jgi:hypothetical protein
LRCDARVSEERVPLGAVALSACGRPNQRYRRTAKCHELHEAREDADVFPALRQVLPAREFRDMAGMFGQAGFEGVVDKVADIEKSLGIYDLSQFTPTAS